MTTAKLNSTKLLGDGNTVIYVFDCAIASCGGNPAEFNSPGDVTSVFIDGMNKNVAFVSYDFDRSGEVGGTSINHLGTNSVASTLSFYDGVLPPVNDETQGLFYSAAAGNGDATVITGAYQTAWNKVVLTFDDTPVSYSGNGSDIITVADNSNVSAIIFGNGFSLTFARAVNGLSSFWTAPGGGSAVWSVATGIDSSSGVFNTFGQSFPAPSLGGLSSPLKYQMARFPRRRMYAGQ